MWRVELRYVQLYDFINVVILSFRNGKKKNIVIFFALGTLQRAQPPISNTFFFVNLPVAQNTQKLYDFRNTLDM